MEKLKFSGPGSRLVWAFHSRDLLYLHDPLIKPLTSIHFHYFPSYIVIFNSLGGSVLFL